MRNNQNLPSRKIDSNNVNGRQLPSTSPVNNNSRSRTLYRSQSRNGYYNNSISKNNRNQQYYRNSYRNNNDRSGSYNRNNFNRGRTNSYNRNSNYNRYNKSRSNSRYSNRSFSRQNSPYNRSNNNNYNNKKYNRQRNYSRDSNRSDRYRQRSNSNNRHYSSNNRDNRTSSSNREQSNRYQPRDRSKDGNSYNSYNKNRINNIEGQTQNDDPLGIDENEYSSESNNEDQKILVKFYNGNEDTCNTGINTLESNPTWILPMYQYNKLEHDYTKQKPILEIDFLLDSGATLNLLNEDTWNEIKFKNPEIQLEKANKTLTAANNSTIETFGTVTLNLTAERTSNSRNKLQQNINIYFYITQCNHNILGTPFFKEYIETINMNTKN